MRFFLDDEHEMLRQSVRSLLADVSPIDSVRRRAEHGEGADVAVWKRASELGATSTLISEDDGGAGASVVEAAVFAQEWGRSLQPGPFIDTNVAAMALVAGGSPALRSSLLSATATGDVRFAWCSSDDAGTFGRTGFHATRGPSGGLELSGVGGFVPCVADATHLIVECAVDDGRHAVVVIDAAREGVSRGPGYGLDITRPLSTVTIDQVVVQPDEVLVGPPESVDDLANIGATLACADGLGAAEAVLEMTVDYAMERETFGRPIGSYQAIKHQCADMVVAIEKSTVALWQAAIALRDGWPDRSRVVGVAKSVAGPACSAATNQALQILGGIGFTWEHDLHLFVRRAKADQLLYGDDRWHRFRIAEMVL